MTSEELKGLVRRYIEAVWNQANGQSLDEFVTADYTYCLGGQPPRDKAAMREFLTAVRVAFPDWRVEIDNIVADSDTAAVRWTGSVTHRGPFHGIPATGKQVSVCGINVYTAEGGRISQEWEQMDSLGLLQQLGALPSPKPPTS